MGTRRFESAIIPVAFALDAAVASPFPTWATARIAAHTTAAVFVLTGARGATAVQIHKANTTGSFSQHGVEVSLRTRHDMITNPSMFVQKTPLEVRFRHG